MEKTERLEEEFELEDEAQAFQEYAYISDVLSVNYSLMADELSKLGDFQKGMAVDLGTGLGDLAIEVSRRYPGMKVTGIDISPKAIEEATQKAKHENLNNVDFQLGDVHNLGFVDDSVDLVVSHGCLHHLKDLPKTFLEIYRVLKPNGLAYLTDLRRDAPEEVVKEIENNLPSSQARAFINSVRAAYIPEELEKILNDIGIKDFAVLEQRFSRETILKNKEKLRKSSLKSANYNKLSQTIVIRK